MQFRHLYANIEIGGLKARHERSLDFRSLAFEQRTDFSDNCHSSGAEVLANSNLLKEDWDSAKQHRDEVDDKEDTTAVLEAQIREAPDV